MIEKVYNVVGLPKIVLNVVIFGGYAELDELVLESPALFKKTMYFSLDFHRVSVFKSSRTASPFPCWHQLIRNLYAVQEAGR